MHGYIWICGFRLCAGISRQHTAAQAPAAAAQGPSPHRPSTTTPRHMRLESGDSICSLGLLLRSYNQNRNPSRVLRTARTTVGISYSTSSTYVRVSDLDNHCPPGA